MNIAKLQAQLQKVPDQALIGYVQNPDGQVPSYLALAELSRRKEIRKTATPKGPSPTQSVAAQEVSQVEPGVAGLPVRDDMYASESFADGGIVAFAGGGLSESDLAYQEAINNTFLDKGYRGLSNMASGIGGYGMDVLTDLATLPGQARWVRDPVTGKLVHAYETEGWMPRSSDTAPARVAGKESANKILEQSRQEIAPKQTTPAILPYADPRVTADKNAAQIRADIAAGKYDKKEAPPSAASTKATTPAGIGSLGYDKLKYTPYTVDEAGFDALMPKERAMRDYAAEFKSELGEDPNRAKLRERLAGMQSKAAKEEAQAPWMALAEAGLGMAAGKSQFALQNIAEGGKQGIKSFVDAKDRMVKAEERRFDIESKLAQAERAEQLAAINYGADSKRADDASRRTIGLEKQRDIARAAEVNAKGKYEEIKDKYAFQQKDKEIELMDKRIDKQIASSETQGKRFELQNQRESLKTIMNEVNDQLKAEQASMNPDPTKITALQAKFNNAYNALYALAVQGSGGQQPSGNRPSLDKFNLK